LQNKKQKHYLPNKFAEFLTAPFYLLAFVCFLTLSDRIVGFFSKKEYTLLNYSSPILISEIIIGLIFLIFSAFLYTYLNFFEKSFPSCISTKNNQKLTGIYNYIRHPSYYIFSFISFGSALCLQNIPIFILSAISHFCLYFDYVIEENQMKKTNDSYADYLKKTNRFFPVFKKRKKD
jgi:protein-S-isoprenylcysteine O-methyltransferase Ste14